MLFNSFFYMFAFLPLSVLGFFVLNKLHLTLFSRIWLVAASLFFYSWWNINYLPLLIGSILFNYSVLTLLSKESYSNTIVTRKRLMIFGIAVNVAFLGYFKYTNFFISTFNQVTNANIGLLSLIFPLGISFFTITQITFLVDCYEGLVKKTNLLNYSLFVTFFPHLIMGPILHHKDMMPQFDSLRAKVFNKQNLVRGLLLFTIGLIKKVGIADMFSSWADYGFDTASTLTLAGAWKTSLSYSLQLYFDFSGYTDMALGSSLMLNINLPINFNSPYKARNFIEFWQKWHISLTNFITTYLYSPILKYSKKITFRRAMLSTYIAMLIAGLWHGASLLYISFYLLTATGLVVNHTWRKRKRKMNGILATILTFNFVNIFLVLFRAKSYEAALKVLRGMAGLTGLGLESFRSDILQYGAIFIFLMVCFFSKNSMELSDIKTPSLKIVLISLCLLITSVIIMIEKNMASEFLYFNF
ncbi:MAG: MBOAT family protein [Nitrospirae bacterium]|nr:MBOAT family protein [Nitrospirota bacterium]